MKVLICIPCLLTGGTEIQTLNLIEALTEGGHQVIVVCYFKFSNSMVLQYQEAGCKVICFSPEGKRITGLKSIIFLWRKLRQVVHEEKPDVAHIQYMNPGAIPILLLRLLGMRNIIATAHTSADIYPNLWLIHFIQKHCVRVFTCITQRAEESFFGSSVLYNSKTILKRRNHFTIYNALPSYIHIRESKKKFSDEVVRLGVVSRLEQIKGMDLVIPAYAKLKSQYPAIRLLIVGDGSQKETMKQQALDMKVDDDIEWAGRQDQSALQVLYDRIDILLMPSRSEGFGLTAIEGMARGCVVVASDTGGLSEVVKDEVVGLLHKTEDIENIVAKIRLLLSDRAKMAKLSQNAQLYVVQFSFERYAAAFCNLYKRIDSF